MRTHNLLYLAGGIVLAVMILSCQTEQDIPEVDISTVLCSIPQINVEEDFATGRLDTLSSTRGSFSGNNFLWSEGDRIGIVPNSGAQIYFAVDNGAGSSTASFEGGDWAMKSTGTFYAYYPLYPDIFLSKDHVPVSYTGQVQIGNDNSLHTGDYWTLYTEGTTAVGNTLNFSFKHLTSFFKAYVTVPAGTYTKITFSAPSEVFIKDGYFDLSAQTPTIVGTRFTDELCLDLQNITFTKDTELIGLLVVAPVNITGIPITVTVFKDEDAAYEYSITKTKPMSPGTAYAFRATDLTQVATSAAQANALFASGATSVTITEPLTEDATVVLPNTEDAVTLSLPTTASTSKLTVSYPQDATSNPATLSITGPEGADLDIQTPNTTVTINGISYDYITSRTAANTCIISEGVTVSVLKVLQGSVQVYGTVSQIDLSEQEDDCIINVSGTVDSLLGEDDEEYGPVTGVSLNKSSIDLNVGDSESLIATVAPDGAYPGVIWTTSDDAVATVSASGMVTAVAEGSATIMATTIYGGSCATCTVSVTEALADYSGLTLEAVEDGVITISNPLKLTIEYSRNGINWTVASDEQISIDIATNKKVFFRGNNSAYATRASSSSHTQINCSSQFYAYGNIMSLIDSEQFESLTSLEKEYTFGYLFQNNDKLLSHPSKQLELPATTLANYCYTYMFRGCSSMTAAPELPATTLANFCYRYMFSGCSSLTAAPELPATSLAYECYGSMFVGCTSLTTAPRLPATTLVDYCYGYMFNGCTSLTTAPALPATTLVARCYEGMFSKCTSLTVAPELSATTIAGSCYYLMFSGCTSLTTAPNLPATSLGASDDAYYCYKEMFKGCTALINAQEVLPATELAVGCYSGMFKGCTSLMTTPVLPAPSSQWQQDCYKEMFNGCQSLSAITVYYPAALNDFFATDWLTKDSGTFYCKSIPTTIPSVIPDGWVFVAIE